MIFGPGSEVRQGGVQLLCSGWRSKEPGKCGRNGYGGRWLQPAWIRIASAWNMFSLWKQPQAP